MNVPRISRALVLVVVPICIGVAAGTITPSRAQTGDVSLSLVEQTPWTTNEAPMLTVSVATINMGDAALEDLSIGLDVGPAIDSRFQYESALAFGPSSVVFSTDAPLTGTLAAGTGRTMSMSLDVSDMPSIDPADSAVYPAQVIVRSAGTELASLNTPLLHIVQTPDQPVAFAWWMELTAPVAFAPDGRLADTAFELSLAPEGSLHEPVAKLAELEGVLPEPIDLVIQPSLLDQARRMVDGYERTTGQVVERGTGGAQAAATFLELLQGVAAAEDVQVSAMPFSGPSIPAMLGSGLARELIRQRVSGGRLMGEVLNVVPAETVARPPQGLIDDATLENLAVEGVLAVLADADTVERLPQGELGFAPPATATVTVDDGDAISLVLPDPSTQTLLERPDVLLDPVRAAQAVLGELAVIWKEQPNPSPQPDGTPTVRGLALRLASELPPTIWEPLLRRLAAAPFLERQHAHDLVTSVNPPGPLTTLRAPEQATFSDAYAAEIRTLQHDVDAYASMLTEASTLPTVLHRDLMYAESAVYVGDEQLGRAWLDEVQATTQAAFASTTPTLNQVFTFTSAEGQIPLRMGDPGEIPLEVTVQVSSSDFDFPEGDRQTVILEQPNQIVTFPVVARGSGPGTILVEVFAGTSGRRISLRPITVRTTALNNIALVVTAGAAVLLLLLYARRWVRRRTIPS